MPQRRSISGDEAVVCCWRYQLLSDFSARSGIAACRLRADELLGPEPARLEFPDQVIHTGDFPLEQCCRGPYLFYPVGVAAPGHFYLQPVPQVLRELILRLVTPAIDSFDRIARPEKSIPAGPFQHFPPGLQQMTGVFQEPAAIGMSRDYSAVPLPHGVYQKIRLVQSKNIAIQAEDQDVSIIGVDLAAR